LELTSKTGNLIYKKAKYQLEKDRMITIENMTKDITTIAQALYNIKDLTPEGKVILEDLLGLLEFEINKIHQIDALMIIRRTEEFSGHHWYDKIVLENRVIQ